MMTNEVGKLLTAAEVAEMLHLHVNTVKRLGELATIGSGDAPGASDPDGRVAEGRQQGTDDVTGRLHRRVEHDRHLAARLAKSQGPGIGPSETGGCRD